MDPHLFMPQRRLRRRPEHLPVAHRQQRLKRPRLVRWVLLTCFILLLLRRVMYDGWSVLKVGLIRVMHHTPRPPPVCRSSTRPNVDTGLLQGYPPDTGQFPRPERAQRRPRVALVTVCDEVLEDICGASVANKRAYAERHGYTLIVANHLIDASRPTAWTKILAVQEAVERYDLVFWSDVDALVMNPNVRVQDLMDYEYDQMLAADHNGLNSGVWLIQSTPFSRWFLKELWAQDHLVKMPFVRSVFHYEQRAFHYLYQTKVWRNKVGDYYEHANIVRAHTNLVHQCVFNSLLAFYKDGDFVVHLAGVKGVAKCLIFRRYYMYSMRMMGAPTVGDAAVPGVLRCLGLR